MAKRSFGVEVESELWDHARKPVYPTIAREYYGDITLQPGFMEIGDHAAVAYEFLHNNVWGHFEVVVEPFRGQENIREILLQAYDLAINLPLQYQPWTVDEDEGHSCPDKITYEKVVNPKDCITMIKSVDVSIKTSHAELGLDESSMPSPMNQSAFQGEWWLNRLPFGNEKLRIALANPLEGVTEVIPLFRRIDPDYVLHVNHVLAPDIRTSKQAAIEAVRGTIENIIASFTAIR